MRLHALEPLLVPKNGQDVAASVLDALARVRMVTVPSLLAYGVAEAFDPEVLQAWRFAGLVQTTKVVLDPVNGTTVEIAALTHAGARALTAATGRRAKGIPSVRLRASNQKRVHDVGVGETGLAFLAAGRAGIANLLGVECDDEALATSVVRVDHGGAVRVPLKADAYVLTERGLQKSALLIEYDRGTIATRSMAERYRSYAAWRAAGGPERTFGVRALRVLTVVPDERRLQRLHDAALGATGCKRSGFFLFAEAKHFSAADPARLSEPIARSLGDRDFAPLLLPR